MHILIQILNLIAHLVHFFWIRSKSICIYSLPPNYKKEGGGGGGGGYFLKAFMTHICGDGCYLFIYFRINIIYFTINLAIST